MQETGDRDLPLIDLIGLYSCHLFIAVFMTASTGKRLYYTKPRFRARGRQSCDRAFAEAAAVKRRT